MTDQYAVIGNPIAHSKSPEIHTMFAEQFKDRSAGNIVYRDRILAPLDGFATTIARLRAEGYKGCNVTVPFKFEAFDLADTQSDRAEISRSANTLKFESNTVFCDNTDGTGLVNDIQQNLGLKLQGLNALLLGAGGAAWGVALPLLQEGANLTIVNRTSDRARALKNALDIFLKRKMAARLGLEYGLPTFVQSFAELAGKQFDVVINATSSGLSDEMPPLPPGIFAPGALAYDMMYGRETPFMKFAREQGAGIVADGLGMLVEQAAESFFIWRGVKPDTRPVMEALRNAK